MSPATMAMTAPGPVFTASLDATIAVAHHLRDEWGDYGYSLAIVGDTYKGAIGYCQHQDGSRFQIHADRYGNITTD